MQWNASHIQCLLLITLFTFVTACQETLDEFSKNKGNELSTDERVGSLYIYDQNRDGIHDYTGLKLDSEGWSIFEKSDDTNVIYVSATEGNDLNDGLSPARPVKTVAQAYKLARDGHPDWILLKRGESWPDEEIMWKKSGLSQTEPMLIGAYGSLSLPRPYLKRIRTSYGPHHPGAVFSHTAIVSLQLHKLERQIGGKNWLIEDCLFSEEVGGGAALQGLGDTPLENVVIRRSTFYKMSPDTGHSQGAYLHQIDGLLLEENVFDHNGWSTVEEQTMFNHNIYIQYTTKNVIMRGNISARASSNGVHQRSGGENYHNLFVQNPLTTIGYTMGGSAEYGPFVGRFSQNVILDSRDIADLPRGFGLFLFASFNSLTVEDNIVAHLRNGSGNLKGISIGTWGDQMNKFHNASIRNNIVYDWQIDGKGSAFEVSDISTSDFKNVRIENNHFQQVEGGKLSLLGSEAQSKIAEFRFRNNFYFSLLSDAYKPGPLFADYVRATGESGQERELPYPDPQRGIQSYMESLGCFGCNYEVALEIFLQQARQQRKGNWRPEYTSLRVINHVREGFGKAPIGAIQALAEDERQ